MKRNKMMKVKMKKLLVTFFLFNFFFSENTKNNILLLFKFSGVFSFITKKKCFFF